MTDRDFRKQWMSRDDSVDFQYKLRYDEHMEQYLGVFVFELLKELDALRAENIELKEDLQFWQDTKVDFSRQNESLRVRVKELEGKCEMYQAWTKGLIERGIREEEHGVK